MNDDTGYELVKAVHRVAEAIEALAPPSPQEAARGRAAQHRADRAAKREDDRRNEFQIRITEV
jgi:hypothetical protein